VVERHHLLLERGEDQLGLERIAPLGILNVGRRYAPAVVLPPALRPPAVEDAQVEAPVDGRLDAGGAARLERRNRVVEPHVAARSRGLALRGAGDRAGASRAAAARETGPCARTRAAAARARSRASAPSPPARSPSSARPARARARSRIPDPAAARATRSPARD